MGRYLYKLTNAQGYTRNGTHWNVGVKHEIAKELRDCTKPLCSSSYIHAYENPLVAVLMNVRNAFLVEALNRGQATALRQGDFDVTGARLRAPYNRNTENCSGQPDFPGH